MGEFRLYPISFSSISDYRTCPRQFYHKRVLKDIPWVDTKEIIWGNDVHKALELNLVQGQPLEGRFEFLVPLANKLNALPGDHYGEQKLAVNHDLEPVDYWDSGAWARCIVDRLIINGANGLNLDYKTGKRKAEFSPQLSMSSAIAFSWFPDVQTMGNAYIWTQGGKPTQKIHKRIDIELIWDPVRATCRDIEWSLKNNAWPPNPSGLCKQHCEVLSCAHNGKRKK